MIRRTRHVPAVVDVDALDDESRSLHDDKGGAIMIMGLFMAVFLVALLYYIVGITEAVIHREAMQDAADATSFAGASMNARGMNLIVLLNIIMAVAVAVLLALRVAQVLVAIGTAIATGLCFFPGIGCAVLPTLANINIRLNNIINRVETAVQKITKVASKAQDVIALVWPALSQVRAVDMSRASAYSPPSEFGFVWPVWGRLPVDDDRLRETCDRGGKMVKDVVAAPFEAIPVVGGAIGSAVSGSIGAILTPLKAYYCGASDGDSSEPPSFGTETTVGFPESAVQQACAHSCINPDTGDVEPYSGCDPCRSSRDSPACQTARESVCEDYTASRVRPQQL